MRIANLRRSIAAKLVLALLGVSVLLILLTTAFELHRSYTEEVRDLERRILDIERSFLPPIAESVWLTDYETLHAQVMGIQRLPEICYVEVEIDGQKVVADGIPPQKTDEALVHTLPLKYHYRDKDLVLGSLVLYGDLGAIYRRLLKDAWWVVANRLVTIALISAVLFFLYYGLVGRHLRTMAAYLRSFDQGRMDTPLVLAAKMSAPPEEMDEIDQVVHSFNELRQNLKRSFDSLHQVNAELLRENRERIKAEAALRESEQRYSLLVNTIPEVFWMFSADFREILFISPAYEEIWGRSCESLLAEPRSWFEAVVEEDQGPLASVIDTMTKGKAGEGQIDFPEYRVQRPDGTQRWIKAKAVSLRDGAGEIWGFAGLCEDITSRKETEDKLRQAQKMEAIGTLAGGIAHDFNNILAAILGYADLLRYDIEEADPRRNNVEQIIRAGNRAKALVQQILAFSRKSESQRRPVMVAPIVKEALKLLRASIPTTIEIIPTIGDLEETVLADPVQIHQVVVNLCTNASHAMEERGGRLSVSLGAITLGKEEAAAMQGNPGRYLRLAVADTGCGMDEATRQRIFDPYFTTKQFGKGSGMGLAVVHGIVQSCGGMIRVTSRVGAGSSFEVFLPAVDLPAEPERGAITSCPTGRERILLVDDEPAIIDTARQWLIRLGYSVVAVTSSIEALTLFRNDPKAFDLLVTDQTMPHLPGSELAREVLALRPDLPILLCTGYSSILTEGKAQEIGIRGYAHKPLHGSELAQRVRQLLDGQGERGSAG